MLYSHDIMVRVRESFFIMDVIWKRDGLRRGSQERDRFTSRQNRDGYWRKKRETKGNFKVTYAAMIPDVLMEISHIAW